MKFEEPKSFLCHTLRNIAVLERDLVIFGQTREQLALHRRRVGADWSSPTPIDTPDRQFLAQVDLRHTSLWSVAQELQLLVYSYATTSGEPWRRPLAVMWNSGNPGSDWLVRQTGVGVEEWNVFGDQTTGAGKTLLSLQMKGWNYFGTFSQDGGMTWSELEGELSLPSELSQVKPPARFGRWQIMATEDGDPHVFVNFSTETEEGVLHYRGVDGSEFRSVSWEPGVVVEKLGRNRALPQHLYRLARYSSSEDSEQDASLVVSLSKDGGGSWERPTTILENMDQVVSDSLQIEGHGDLLVCGWHQQAGRDATLYFSASQDGGQSWSPARELIVLGRDGYRLFVLEKSVAFVTAEDRYDVYGDGRVQGFVDVSWAEL